MSASDEEEEQVDELAGMEALEAAERELAKEVERAQQEPEPEIDKSDWEQWEWDWDPFDEEEV